MTTTVLLTTVAEGTGKTVVSLALATAARDRGLTAGYMKPKGTRLESVVGKTLDTDPVLAREVLDLDAELEVLEPVVYSPTFVEQAIRGREDPSALRASVRERFESLAADRDLMVVEGGGTLETGRVVELADPAVADLLDAAALLVVEYDQPGDIDRILTAADRFGDAMAGVLFNAVDEPVYDRLEADVIPFLERQGVPVVGVLPRVTALAGVTVADLAEQLNAERLAGPPGDAYVERFIVGAMGADTSLRYFRRTKDAALITGGDRAEIQSVALEAPGIKCLVLTGGVHPSNAILAKADDRGVPVLLVQPDTMSTIDRAEAVVSAGRTPDADAVDRMRALLAEHADVEALLGAE
ncbi:MAG: AAA family ATPase [Halobacteriales archaeon]